LASGEEKNKVLISAAQLLLQNEEELLQANAKDLARVDAISPAFRDRLVLDSKRIRQMAESLRQVSDLPDLVSDPVLRVIEKKQLKNGLVLKKIRAPLGVIFLIYESRPNVAVEAFSLAFKSSNGILLKGGKESKETTTVLYRLLKQAFVSGSLSSDCFWGIQDENRTLTPDLLSQNAWIDVVIPRGGEKLIEFVVRNTTIPMIKNDRGLCHVYVHEDADVEMAKKIVINAKTQRPGVCNAMETLLVHQKIAQEFLPLLYQAFENRSVQWWVCPRSLSILKGKSGVHEANASSWDTEYLDFVFNCKVVDSLEQAIDHIEEHGSRHSEAIVTQSQPIAQIFQNEVDAAAIYWNASTRFTDGFEFGLGGEMGISTQKLHVRGPVGLNELTSTHWIIDGTGQVRV
jgi:glutamate-5-semialdehyde dehydrogenase